MSSILHVGSQERTLPSPEVTLKVASILRLGLEVGPLHLSVPLEAGSVRDLLAGGPSFAAAPGADDDPVFLEGEVLAVTMVGLFPQGERRFRLQAHGTLGRFGSAPVPWKLEASGRVDHLEVEDRSEKVARARLVDLLPKGGPSPRIEAHEIPEIGLWLVDADWA